MNKKVKSAPASGKAVLEDAIRQLGLVSRAKLLWIMHPLLEDVAIRFAAYIGPHTITEAGTSLLQATLSEAFSKHKAEVDKTENDHFGQAIFARTLLQHSKEIFAQNIVVSTDGGAQKWNPFVCGAVEFLTKFTDAEVTAARTQPQIADQIAQALMLVNLVPKQMLDNETITELFNDATITA